MKIHTLEGMPSSYSSAYTTLLSAGIDDTVVTHLKFRLVQNAFQIKNITKRKCFLNHCCFPLNTVPKFHKKYQINTQKKNNQQAPNIGKTTKKTICFVDVQKTSPPHWLAHLLPAYGQASVLFHCEWSGSMEATAISWALPPHLGTFHISSLCAGVNDAVVADLQVLGPKLLICHVFFWHHHFTSQQKQLDHTDSSEHKIQKQRSRAAIFLQKNKCQRVFVPHKKSRILQHQPIQPQWIVPGFSPPIQGPTMDQTSLGLRSLSCIQMSHSSAFWGLLQGRWARGDEKIKVAICVHNV